MPPRIGIIGAGIFGTLHLQVFTQLLRQGQVSHITFADLNSETVARQSAAFGVRGYTDVRAMLAEEKLDAVTVVTPDFAHRPVVLQALAAGCHVLVEKPMDVTVAGCEEIIAAAKQAGKLLQVDFHKRFDPYHIETHEMVRQGQLGAMQYGYAWMEDTIEVPRDWFAAWVHRSSPGWFLGVHMYDLLSWIIGDQVVSVYATGTKRLLVSLGRDTYDSLQAHLTFKQGAHVTVQTSWILPESFEAGANQGFRLVGDAGMAEVDSQNRGMEACTTKKGMITPNKGFFMETHDRSGRIIYGGYGVESIADFVRNVSDLQSGATLAELEGHYAGGQAGRAATAVAVAVHKSAATGKVIQIA
jgi:predicted dehydrogenase